MILRDDKNRSITKLYSIYYMNIQNVSSIQLYN